MPIAIPATLGLAGGAAACDDDGLQSTDRPMAPALRSEPTKAAPPPERLPTSLPPEQGADADGFAAPPEVASAPDTTALREPQGYTYGAPFLLEARGDSGPSPRVRGSVESVRGSIPRELVRRIIRRNINALRACYQEGVTRRPDLVGRVVVRFVISTTGMVSSASIVTSTMGDRAVEGCLLRAIEGIRFPSQEGETVIVVYSFMFDTASE
jgi:TonB family protein